MGRIVAGGFKDDIKPLDSDDQRRMLYMQSTLELSMKGEFDENLGCVNYITTYHQHQQLPNNQYYTQRISGLPHILDHSH